MLKEANFYPKLFGQVEEIEDEKVQEFEESLNNYLKPYLENALETGWLIGKNWIQFSEYSFLSSHSAHARKIRKLIPFVWYSIYRDSVCTTDSVEDNYGIFKVMK